MHPDVVSIAYAPGRFHASWRAVYPTLSVEQQAWLNTWLLRTLRLPLPSAFDLPSCAVARRLISRWGQLQQICVLVAAAQLRRWVLADRGSLALPPGVHAFMHGGHPGMWDDPGVAPACAAEPGFLAWWGARVIAQAPGLPAWLRSRMALATADTGGYQALDAVRLQRCEWNEDLFWNAVMHVERTS